MSLEDLRNWLESHNLKTVSFAETLEGGMWVVIVCGYVRLYFDRTKWSLCTSLYDERYPLGSEELLNPQLGLVHGHEDWGKRDFGNPKEAQAFARKYLIRQPQPAQNH